jgi:tetratricopeptide (TPR) repeat protein
VKRFVAALLLTCLGHAAAAGATDVAALEQRSRAFYGLLEKGQREQAAAQWPQLERDLATAVEQARTDRDRLQADLEGGDDEEPRGAARDPRLRQLEVERLILEYHLAWVRYQAADLVDDAGRKGALLDNAIDGFSRFAEMKGVPEVYAESLYGRGLAYMELRDFKNAREDLNKAAKLPKTAQRAAAALAEVERRESGKPPPPVEPADPDKPLLDKLTAGLPKAGADPAVEKDVASLARGLAARGGEWPAKVQALVTKTLGDGTVAGMRSSYGLYLLGQLAIDRNACGDLAPLVAAGAGLKDAGRAQWRPELLFFQGGCLLNAGKAGEAAAVFGELVRDFPDAPRASEAAYLRIRALDVARAKDPAHGAAFEEALVTYVTRYPKADGVAEAHWLLGDLHRTRGDCAKAAVELGKVPAGPYASRARLAALECRTAALSARTTAAERAALAKDLRAFVDSTPPKGPDEPLVARAALMGALVAAGTTPPDRDATIALLADFEKKYPGSKDLFPRALEARLEARVALGQLDDADRDLDAWLAAESGDGDRTRTLSRLGRDLAALTARTQGAERDRSRAMARKVYAALVREGGGAADRIQLANLELTAGDAEAARTLYDEVLAQDASSAEALRGAARAAAAAGDTDAALGYWRRVVDGSEPGGTAWYEARIEQVTLLAAAGRPADACAVLRASRGRSTSAGGDTLAKRLAAMEPEVCR